MWVSFIITWLSRTVELPVYNWLVLSVECGVTTEMESGLGRLSVLPVVSESFQNWTECLDTLLEFETCLLGKESSMHHSGQWDLGNQHSVPCLYSEAMGLLLCLFWKHVYRAGKELLPHIIDQTGRMQRKWILLPAYSCLHLTSPSPFVFLGLVFL